MSVVFIPWRKGLSRSRAPFFNSNIYSYRNLISTTHEGVLHAIEVEYGKETATRYITESFKLKRIRDDHIHSA